MICELQYLFNLSTAADMFRGSYRLYYSCAIVVSQYRIEYNIAITIN